MTGTPWHVAVFIGALLIFLAGLATALRGLDWPVMSARYDAPGTTGADRTRPGASASSRPRDAATMWESLNEGEDPTEDDGTVSNPANESTGDESTGEHDPSAAEDARA
jgi:uncharacterized membrane protein (TIGR02234 family)